MTWQQLIASNRAKAHKTSKQEIDGLRAVVDQAANRLHVQKGILAWLLAAKG